MRIAVASGWRSLQVVALVVATLTGPVWLRFTARAQGGPGSCNYSCALGAYDFCDSYYSSNCADGGNGMCTVTYCGMSCKNKAGQSCGASTPSRGRPRRIW